MGHSFINAKINSNTERSVSVPDGVLHIFMYFFNEIAYRNVQPNSPESQVCEHYQLELAEVHSTWIEAMLQEISENTQLLYWYLSILSQLETKLDSFGEYIDNNYLNQIPELLVGCNPGQLVFTGPVEVAVIKDLINDIYWVLGEEGRTPSGNYVWFIEKIDLSGKIDIEQDFIIVKASSLVKVKKKYPVDKELGYLAFRNIIEYFQRNGLTNRMIITEGSQVNDDTLIKYSDLTKEGFELEKRCFNTWIEKAFSKQISPTDYKILNKALIKIRQQHNK
jgi:hypothetical protein